MPDDREIFDKAESDLRQLKSQLQVTFPELMTSALLALAKDLGISLPAAFQGLTTSYALFLSGSGNTNDEKGSISQYLGRVSTDIETLQWDLITRIIKERAIANVQPLIPVPLPPAPYVPPQPKRPNPPPVTGLSVSLTGATTGTVGTAIALSAAVVVPPGRSVTKVEFYEDATKLGEDTTAPYSFSYTPASSGSKSITARAYDDSPSPVVSTSNAVVIVVTAPAVPIPTVAIAATTPKAGLINEATIVNVTASITGDTISGVQIRADGVNVGSPDTTAPYSANYTPTTKGIKQLSAVATGVLGGTATSANYSFQAFDSKVIGGGAGVGGTSLGANAADYMLFDTNLAGGNASTMVINVNGTQVGAFNYDDTSYSGKPFAYYYGATNTLYTDTVKATVNF